MVNDISLQEVELSRRQYVAAGITASFSLIPGCQGMFGSSDRNGTIVIYNHTDVDQSLDIKLISTSSDGQDGSVFHSKQYKISNNSGAGPTPQTQREISLTSGSFIAKARVVEDDPAKKLWRHNHYSSTQANTTIVFQIYNNNGDFIVRFTPS